MEFFFKLTTPRVFRVQSSRLLITETVTLPKKTRRLSTDVVSEQKNKNKNKNLLMKNRHFGIVFHRLVECSTISLYRRFVTPQRMPISSVMALWCGRKTKIKMGWKNKKISWKNQSTISSGVVSRSSAHISKNSCPPYSDVYK